MWSILIKGLVDKRDNLVVFWEHYEGRKAMKRRRTFYEMLVKRPIDIVLALCLIIVTTPIMILVVGFEWIFHGRGVLFKQRRVGRGRKIFYVYKFRSMTNKRGADGNLLPDKDRITKFGKFIRKTSLDELPQLFNILKGDMSLIGPRPKDIKECVFFSTRQCNRYDVRPGLTGLQQVSGRSKLNCEEVIELDLKYIKKITFLGDLWIFLKTFFVVLSQKNVNSPNENAANFGWYYNDLLLERGDITQEENDYRIKFSKTLKVGDIMPTVDEQRKKEFERANEIMKKEMANFESAETKAG
jgi:lipopolysaccharide/colanic/teichoic acid biosynthesis glycosyltransferase